MGVLGANPCKAAWAMRGWCPSQAWSALSTNTSLSLWCPHTTLSHSLCWPIWASANSPSLALDLACYWVAAHVLYNTGATLGSTTLASTTGLCPKSLNLERTAIEWGSQGAYKLPNIVIYKSNNLCLKIDLENMDWLVCGSIWFVKFLAAAEGWVE